MWNSHSYGTDYKAVKQISKPWSEQWISEAKTSPVLRKTPAASMPKKHDDSVTNRGPSQFQTRSRGQEQKRWGNKYLRRALTIPVMRGDRKDFEDRSKQSGSHKQESWQPETVWILNELSGQRRGKIIELLPTNDKDGSGALWKGRHPAYLAAIASRRVLNRDIVATDAA